MTERVAIFGPNPLLTVAVERRGDGDDIHFHAGGQGVWVARMAGELGAHPVLCGLIGAEPGIPLEALLEQLPGEHPLVRAAGPTGSYVVDRRTDERRVLASAWSPPPSRHETDELFSVTTTAASRRPRRSRRPRLPGHGEAVAQVERPRRRPRGGCGCGGRRGPLRPILPDACALVDAR